MKIPLVPAILANLLLTLLTVPGAGAQPFPLGPAFRIDAGPDGAQNSLPRVGASDAGDFVVVWKSEQGGDHDGLYGRGFRLDGTPRGGEFRLDEDRSTFVDHPALAVGPLGNFIAAWTGTSENDSNVFARRFLADGSPRDGEVLVNPRTAGFQGPPDVAFLPNGAEYVVVWPSVEPDPWGADLFASRFDRHGRIRFRGRRVNQARRHNQSHPSVAGMGDGFVTVWENIRYDVRDFGITARLFDSQDRARTGDLPVNAVSEGYQNRPVVASGVGSGRFLAVWQSTGNGATGFEIVARLFDVNGRPVTGEFQVNTGVEGHQTEPAVAMNARGDFVIAWHSQPFGGVNAEVRARWFRWDGTPLGGELGVAQGQIGAPDVAIDDRGNFVVVWPAREESGGFERVLGRRFAAPCTFGPAVALAGGRFEAEACWSTPHAEGVPALPLLMTNRAAAFSFSQEGLPDLAIKILDGRPVNDHFWVFGASLSHLQSLVRITDTTTGEVRLYLSPHVKHSRGDLVSFADVEALPAASTAATEAAGEALRLLAGRAEVRVTWTDPDGTPRNATAVPLSDGAGYFWFFDPENPEVVVKILDSPSVPGSSWVFLGGLSNLAYTVTVTSRTTGRSVTYTNAAGQVGSRFDLSVFLP